MFFVYMDILTLKFILKTKGFRIGKAILGKKSKVTGLLLSDFKTYYKDIVIKTVWCWQRRNPEFHATE